MKNKIHISYLVILLIIASPLFSEPTKLLGVTTEEYGGNQYLVLEFNGPDVEYVTPFPANITDWPRQCKLGKWRF